MKIRNLILGLSVACFLPSCGVMKDQYNVVLRNVGSVKLAEAHVSYGTFYSAGGVLSPGNSSTHMQAGHEAPIPEKAKVEWLRVMDGKTFNKIVKVKSIIPKGRFRGDIIFLFNDDSVDLTWKKEK